MSTCRFFVATAATPADCGKTATHVMRHPEQPDPACHMALCQEHATECERWIKAKRRHLVIEPLTKETPPQPRKNRTSE